MGCECVLQPVLFMLPLPAAHEHPRSCLPLPAPIRLPQLLRLSHHSAYPTSQPASCASGRGLPSPPSGLDFPLPLSPNPQTHSQTHTPACASGCTRPGQLPAGPAGWCAPQHHQPDPPQLPLRLRLCGRQLPQTCAASGWAQQAPGHCCCCCCWLGLRWQLLGCCCCDCEAWVTGAARECGWVEGSRARGDKDRVVWSPKTGVKVVCAGCSGCCCCFAIGGCCVVCVDKPGWHPN